MLASVGTSYVCIMTLAKMSYLRPGPRLSMPVAYLDKHSGTAGIISEASPPSCSLQIHFTPPSCTPSPKSTPLYLNYTSSFNIFKLSNTMSGFNTLSNTMADTINVDDYSGTESEYEESAGQYSNEDNSDGNSDNNSNDSVTPLRRRSPAVTRIPNPRTQTITEPHT